MRQAMCDGCRKHRWVNLITRRGEKSGEFCADCFEHVSHDPPGRGQGRKVGSGANHSDPSLENAVRALEEGR